MRETKTHHADGRAKAPKKLWMYRRKDTGEVFEQIRPLANNMHLCYLIGEYKLVKEEPPMTRAEKIEVVRKVFRDYAEAYGISEYASRKLSVEIVDKLEEEARQKEYWYKQCGKDKKADTKTVSDLCQRRNQKREGKQHDKG